MDISEDTKRKFPNYIELCNAYNKGSQEDLDRIINKNTGSEFLCAACTDGHLDIVQKLLDERYNVNPDKDYKNEPKASPLLLACRNGHSDVAKLLIDRGANVNNGDYDGYTPLRWAVTEGLIDVCIQLINKGAELETKRVLNSKCRLLSLVLIEGLYDVAKLMIEKGAKINAPDWVGDYTPFFWACYKRNSELALLLIEYGATENAKPIDGRTPLLLACSNGLGDVALELIKRNAQVDVSDYMLPTGATPFYLSCLFGLYDVVVTLISKGIIINPPADRLLVPLKLACEDGHVDVVSTLIGVNKAIVNAIIDEFNFTPLMVACLHGKSDIAIVLIKSGANVNVKDMNGSNSPLALAATEGLTEVVKLLIENNAKMNEVDMAGVTPLFRACDSGHNEVAVTLLNAGADASLTTKYGISPLLAAVQHQGLLETVKLLLNTEGIALEVTNNNGCTPLYLACERHFSDIALLLIKNGASVNVDSSYDGCTVLQLACSGGLTDVAKALVNKGADIKDFDRNGDTALLTACRNGHSEIAMFLINHGADVHVTNKRNHNPLFYACEKKLREVALLLIEKMDFDLTDEDGRTLLQLACSGGITDIAKALVNKGVDLEDFDRNGDTALLTACRNGHSEIAMFLINHGADIHVTNKENRNSLFYVCEKGLNEVALLLIEKMEFDLTDEELFQNVKDSLKYSDKNYELKNAIIQKANKQNTAAVVQKLIKESVNTQTTAKKPDCLDEKDDNNKGTRMINEATVESTGKQRKRKTDILVDNSITKKPAFNDDNDNDSTEDNISIFSGQPDYTLVDNKKLSGILGNKDLLDVMAATNSITDWSVLSLLFGILPAEFCQINRQVLTSGGNLQMQIISRWFQLSNASWSALVQYLCDVRQYDLAQEITKAHPC